MELEKIFSNDKTLIAIILKHDFIKTGVSFITEDYHELQIAYISNSVGHETIRHYHPKFERVITKTMECLIVKKGKVEVILYDNYQLFVKSLVIVSGDIMLFIDGGHSLKNIEQSELIEIRQGPYNQLMDKIKF